jgi:cell division protein FtsW (lipid II flippase)
MALERLQVSTGPRARRRFAARGERFEPVTTPLWDVPRGPAPVAYYVIAVVVTAFVILGLVMVLSASAQTEVGRGRSAYAIFNRQLMWAALGTVGLLAATRVNLTWIKRLSRAGLVVAGVGMLAPFVPGVGLTINDARAWIDVGAFTMQPSEFLKLAVVVFAADLLVRRQHDLTDVHRSLKPLVLLAVVAAGACLAQRDLGSVAAHRHGPAVRRRCGAVRRVEPVPDGPLHGLPRSGEAP